MVPQFRLQGPASFGGVAAGANRLFDGVGTSRAKEGCGTGPERLDGDRNDEESLRATERFWVYPTGEKRRPFGIGGGDF